MRYVLGWTIVLLLAFGGAALAAETSVNGRLTEIDGQRVLQLWGDSYEMGFAHGYLVGDEIIDAMHEYILRLLPPALYELTYPLASALFGLPPDYLDEAQGIVDGLTAAGVDPYIAELGRDLDVDDLILCNAVADIGAMACSSQAAWDEATAGDPRLGGETAVVRNLDWILRGEDRFFLPVRTLVFVFSPSDPDLQPVVSVAFPGYFSCLSCLNEEGLTAVVNIAHNGTPLWQILVENYIPIGITLRETMHRRANSTDGDPLTPVIEAIDESRRSGASAITLAVPRDQAAGDPALVLEVDNRGVMRRLARDDPWMPPDIVLATNTLLKMRLNHGCKRYGTMKDLVKLAGGRLTLDDMWKIEGAVIQDYFLSTTSQTIYFLPDRREIGVAFSDSETYSPEKEPAVLTWDELLDSIPADDDSPDDGAAQPADKDESDDTPCG